MNSVDTAWVLVSAALVLFMTPGLALFYGGMVRSKNVLAVMMNNFAAMGVVTVLWVVVAGSLAFGDGGGIIGGFSLVGFAHLGHSLPGFTSLTASPGAVMIYQMMFAIITAALISGGTIDRIKFSSFLVLITTWVLLVYAPLAHWVFSPEGWLAQRGVLDFAGGTVVEINSGFSTLAVILVLGKRRGWPRDPMAPHSVPLTLLGVGILWFGWFGFNAGSALAVNDVAVSAFLNTQLAAATGLLGWLIIDRFTGSHATTLGAASGAVAGMVAITPCAGFVPPMAGLFIGLCAGLICALAVRLKFRFGYDDSLDVLGVHGIGGVVGMVLLGVFASHAINNSAPNGLVYGGGAHLMVVELLATVVCAAFAFGATWIIATVIHHSIGLRVSPEDEMVGLDLSQHSESAYSAGGMGRLSS
ncbi:MAG: ammonium transporter [Actinomycetota bacterium]|jgi:Amt family ammonium transporter